MREKFLELPVAVREQMNADYLRHCRACVKAELEPDSLWLSEAIADALRDVKNARRAAYSKEEYDRKRYQARLAELTAKATSSAS